MTSQIKEMAEAVAARLGLPGDGPDALAVRDALAGYWSDKIALVWTAEDVRSCRKDATDAEAAAALQAVLDRHDASIGVNWDTIVMACDGEYPPLDDDDDDDEEDDDDP
jgi:hypothetical protein